MQRLGTAEDSPQQPEKQAVWWSARGGGRRAGVYLCAQLLELLGLSALGLRQQAQGASDFRVSFVEATQKGRDPISLALNLGGQLVEMVERSTGARGGERIRRKEEVTTFLEHLEGGAGAGGPALSHRLVRLADPLRGFHRPQAPALLISRQLTERRFVIGRDAAERGAGNPEVGGDLAWRHKHAPALISGEYSVWHVQCQCTRPRGGRRPGAQAALARALGRALVSKVSVGVFVSLWLAHWLLVQLADAVGRRQALVGFGSAGTS